MSQLLKAQEAWKPMPEWIVALAECADAEGLKGAQGKTGYAPSTLSQVLSNKYRGDLLKVEATVRGALMGSTVICPILGDMRRDVCLDWQDKPRAATSALRIRMYHACRSGCPFSKHTKETTDA